ncbi:MAG: lipid-A-disaccharide synthase [Gemmatimonadota bacterium]
MEGDRPVLPPRRRALIARRSEILIVAGEPSGDALAAELVRAMREVEPALAFFGATGPELEAAGVERIVDTRELSVMGLFEVVGRLPAAWRSLGRLEEVAVDRGAAGAVLVDSPDFNLRLAGRLAGRGIPVVQYVSPTVWAWRPGRVRVLERAVRRLLLTLPFEAAFYETTNVDAVYVGNPAVDRLPVRPASRAKVADRLGLPAKAPWVAIVPGSREGELARIAPALAAAASRVAVAVPEAAFLAPVAPGLEPEEVATALAGGPPVRLVEERRLEALGHAAAALATSGTVSLELALLGVPHVVAYRAARATYAAARLLVDTDWIALPNLIAGAGVVPEFVQRLDPEALAAPVITWLGDPAARADVVEGLAGVRAAMGTRGVAGRAAAAALEALGLSPPVPGGPV